jgi:type I restriction enzyme R subunit
MLWSNPQTRKTLLEKLDNAGFGKDELDTLKKLIDAEKSDLFDVLKYVFDSNFQPITRQNRAFKAKAEIWLSLNQNLMIICQHHGHCIVMRLLIDINIFENQ